MMFWMVLISMLAVRFNDFSLMMGIGLLDFFSSFMVWLMVGTTVLAYLSSRSLPFLWGMIVVSCIGTFTVSNLFWFYLMFELSLLPIFLMILFWGTQPERLSAGMYFILYTVTFSLPMLIIILMMGMIYFWWPLNYAANMLSYVIIILPFLVKLPVFGFHFWLPKAHVEASTSGSMILASLLLKLGSFGLFRMVQMMAVQNIFSLFMFFGTMIGSVFTVMQMDFKKLVAYSSVTHMTFLAAASMTLNKTFMFMMILFSLAHGWASSGLFFLVGKSSSISYSRLGVLLSSMSNLFWFYLMFGLILMSNSSIPPMPSFFPEVLAVCSISIYVGVIILGFIILSLMVCYFNVILFISLSKSKQQCFKGGMLSNSESVVVFFQVMLSLVSMILISQF